MLIRTTLLVLIITAGLSMSLLVGVRTCGSEDSKPAEKPAKASREQNPASGKGSDRFVLLQSTKPLPAGIKVFVEKVAVHTASARLAFFSSRNEFE